MKSQLTRQGTVMPMEEPDPTGQMEKIALFNPDGSPFVSGGGEQDLTVFPVNGGLYITGAPADPPELILTDTFSVDADPSADWAKTGGAGNDLVTQNGVMNAAGQINASWTASPVIDDHVAIIAHFLPPVTFAANDKVAVGFGDPTSYQNGFLVALRSGNALNIYGPGDLLALATPLDTDAVTPDPRGFAEFWLKCRRSGDTIYGDLYDEDPLTDAVPINSVSYLLTGADATTYGEGTTHKPRLLDGTIFRTDEPTRGVSDVTIMQTFAGVPLSLVAVIGNPDVGYVQRTIIDMDGQSDFS